MIQAVLFDLGNTLIRYYHRNDFLPILRECLRCAAAAAGETIADFDSLFSKAIELNHEAADFAVRRLEDRFLDLFPDCCLADPTVMRNACRAFMAPIFSHARIVDDALEVIDELRARGMRTAVVTNTPWGSSAELWVEELNRHHLLERLDAVTFCVDVGWRKPHPAPFLSTLRKLAIKPSQAVFVGDDPVWDIEGARRVGIRPILVSCEPIEGNTCTTIARLSFLLSSDVLAIGAD